MARHLVAGQPVIGFAVHHDLAGGRLVEATHAVEHRGLAGAVSADDGEHFVAPDLEGHAVDGQQGRRSAWSVRILSNRGVAHLRSSTCGRFNGSNPADATSSSIPSPGRTSACGIRRTRAPSSGSTVSRIAARITPICEPIPPSTTMARISADSMKVNDLVDHALAGREEGAAETGEHGAQREGRQLMRDRGSGPASGRRSRLRSASRRALLACGSAAWRRTASPAPTPAPSGTGRSPYAGSGRSSP